MESLAAALDGRPLLIDGYNALTTVEAALGGGVILVGRDGVYRDMASMHGTWRGVTTLPALNLIGDALQRLGVGSAIWYLDSPVSNSGRLKTAIQSLATERGWNWWVELVMNPDAILVKGEGVAATADSAILDGPVQWFGLAEYVVRRDVAGRGWWTCRIEPPDGSCAIKWTIRSRRFTPGSPPLRKLPSPRSGPPHGSFPALAQSRPTCSGRWQYSHRPPARRRTKKPSQVSVVA